MGWRSTNTGSVALVTGIGQDVRQGLPVAPFFPESCDLFKACMFEFLVLAALASGGLANGAELAALPVQGSAETPVILLELGHAPPSRSSPNASVQIAMGDIEGHSEDSSIVIDEDAVNSMHPGFGTWTARFRFDLPSPLKAKPYTLWARWRQGGEPDVCVQTFEIWAGPDSTKLEQRAVLQMKPKGWEYAWLAGATPLTFKPDDTMVEIRDSGAGHDAKVFDAFLLGPPPPPPALPVIGTAEHPGVLLELGKAPAWTSAEPKPAIPVTVGESIAAPGASSVLQEKDEVQVFHPGFGVWGASFRFGLAQPLAPGLYSFYARYKSGGEVSQVEQTFAVKLGSRADNLASRGTFMLANTAPWEYQWLKAPATVVVLPGDRLVEVDNTGKADGAKVFDAFLLQREASWGDWMSADQAQARNRFLARIKTVPNPKPRLYVLDGRGEQNDLLFRGLSAESARKFYDALQVEYLIGPNAEDMARELGLKQLPAAVATDAHYTILGILAQPKSEAEVATFLADPGQGRTPLLTPPIAADEPKAMRNGVPEAWLVGGLHDGAAGVSVFGLDTEKILRPNLNERYLSTGMMGNTIRIWQRAPTSADGTAVVEARTSHSYGWSRGSGYGQLYFHTERPMAAHLHVLQTGLRTAGWLDGQLVDFGVDAAANRPRSAIGQGSLQGLSTEGLPMRADRENEEAPQVARLELAPGWHSLLLKMVMQHEKDQQFSFSAHFTDAAGRPLDGLKSRLTEPATDLSLNSLASRLRPLIYVQAPANLPHPGEPLRLRVDLRWHPILEESALAMPLPRFQATLRLRMTDYDNKEIATREIKGLFPGEFEVDFGKVPEAGYYALYPSLHTPDGRLIMAYLADGFTVTRGTAAQKERLAKKKLWNNDYYAFNDGDKGFRQDGGYFDWLERAGVFRSLGAYPGNEAQYRSQWALAKRRGIELFADSSGDSNWLNERPEEGEKFVAELAPFTRFFKSTNEIDIRREAGWQKLRDPAHWVDRARREFEAVHKARADGHYIGGSLVRPGDVENNRDYPGELGPGRWFAEVLKLGLDRYQDAWDVHAYPNNAPRFGGPLGNGATEDERGILAVYASLGRKNNLPFWLGEAGAKAAHGFSGRRWQAEQVAKMIAWVNSRNDYRGLAFCIAHEYDWGYGRVWDYSMGHKPGEAALYTAGALIDGLPYKAVATQDVDIQAAYFGGTLMIWRTDDRSSDWELSLDPEQPWVQANVVGQIEPLRSNQGGKAVIRISSSPRYVLTQADYQRLTRN